MSQQAEIVRSKRQRWAAPGGFHDKLVRILAVAVSAAADGYRMTTENVDVDVRAKSMVSRGRVEGRVPAGTFSADRIVANLDERRVLLDGHARLRMAPGKMEMP